MSSLPNTVIRLTPPSLRQNYCPSSWQEFANDLVCGTFAQHKLNRGTTFYNFGNQAPYPPPPTPEPPEPSCLDFGIDWEPASFAADQYVSFVLTPEFPSLNGATSLSFEASQYRLNQSFDVWYLYSNATVTTIDFPNCTQFDNTLDVNGFTELTSISFPQLVTQIGGPTPTFNYSRLTIRNNPKLTSVSTPLLADSGGLTIRDNVLLTTLSMPNLVPLTGQPFRFSGNALDATTVNHILSVFAASAWAGASLNLGGGTNAAPTGQGIIDKATINARPATSVVTN